MSRLRTELAGDVGAAAVELTPSRRRSRSGGACNETVVRDRPLGGQGSAGSYTQNVAHLPNVCLVLITPDSSEIRWVPTVPEPGVRLPGRFPGESLVIDEVLRSGVMTYTVFGSTPPEGRMDHAIDQALDLAAGAIDRVQESVAPTLRPSRLSS